MTMAKTALKPSVESTSTTSTSHNRTTRYTEKWKVALMSGEEGPFEDASKSLSQMIYKAMGNSKKVFVTLCVGLKID